ncbi:hypothetical protein PPYR_13994 [Photinus pyralis]|uniref:Adenylate kinase n=2 Tax=Photinus pyralis TaxID=7054 RepID=A0A5N4A3Y4_PHOPY|nr:GTP:AMP phosphotransferase AK3, mitochondrial-like [Photinus pyralis]KAB0792033.1 hypothetical protein PPYR_13994 [Photinus pyralis]
MVNVPVPELIAEHVKNNTDFGKAIKAALTADEKVSDVPIAHFVLRELKGIGDKSFIVTGFPKTYRQAILLWKDLEFNFVINLDYPKEYLVRFKVGGVDESGTEEEKEKRVALAMENIAKDQKRLSSLIEFYKKQKILQHFYSNTEEEMWKKVKKGVEVRLVALSKT